MDPQTAEAARERLAAASECRVDVLDGDFLAWSAAKRQPPRLWDEPDIPALLSEPFDVVIANPPYVRTQLMGSKKAQELASAFGLSGRVDLYHPFLIGAAESLVPGGLLGVITSNRFLCTRGGSAVREFLAKHFAVLEVIDLGDTKFFEAAVLPAIFIGRKVGSGFTRQERTPARFVRMYSRSEAGDADRKRATVVSTVSDLLESTASGAFSVKQQVFDITVGHCCVPQAGDAPWVMLADRESAWLENVRRHAVGSIKDYAIVRVGIKTTADRVFIRDDWDCLPAEVQPEPELLHDLLTHEEAQRWRLDPTAPPRHRILYTHEIGNGKRKPVDLDRFPRARAYLTAHRPELEAREYVIKAGRNWFEIWVPQDPAAWSLPKVVCPDISPEARFYFDDMGRMVDGDSYWITPLPAQPPELLYLILAVANSRLMSTYHDLAFNNRLYSGRRRYLTQYVANYPLPSLDEPKSREIVALVAGFLTEPHPSSGRVQDIELEVDRLVAAVFCSPTTPDETEAR